MSPNDCGCAEVPASGSWLPSVPSPQLSKRDIGVHWSPADETRRRDIFHVAFLLRCMVPTDLVPFIMEVAEFLEITSASVLMRPTVHCSMEGSIILATPPIVTKVRRHYPAQRVVLNVSIFGSKGHDHDQEGTWIRFTVGKAHLPIAKASLDMTIAGGDQGTRQTQQSRETLSMQVLPDFDLHDNFSRKEYTVVWDRDSAATPRYERGMVEKMQRGDQIKLVLWQSPYACRPGPTFISASISIYTKVIVA